MANRSMLAALLDSLAKRHGVARRAGANSGGDLLDWARTHLPAHFRQPPSRMHLWLAGQLDQLSTRRGVKLNVLGPRGGAKSTVATLAYVLRAALEGQEPYIWIVSDTRHQAHAHLENVKTELAENPSLLAAYPNAAGKGPVWRAGLIVLRSGAAIEAFGTGQRIRGKRRREHRPTLIVCDDLQNDGHVLSATQRERSRQWFHGTLLKAGCPTTNVVHLATALHHDALAIELTRTAGWTSRIFRAIERWPENMTLWHAWERIYADAANPRASEAALAFYQTHQAEMDRGGVVLWPQREGLYDLMRMRAESGPCAFEREKQNSPVNPELCEWPEAWFDESIWFNAWPLRPVCRVMALDPSKGSDARRGDYSALVMLSVDADGVIYVEADMARRSVPQIVADGVEHYRRFRPDAFAVEANQFQDLLAGALELEFHRQGMLDARPIALENRVNKLVRIRRLGPYLTSRRLRFRAESPGTRLLVDQLRQFPVADHDDGPDALEMAIRTAGALLEPPVSDGLGGRLPV